MVAPAFPRRPRAVLQVAVVGPVSPAPQAVRPAAVAAQPLQVHRPHTVPLPAAAVERP